MSTRIAFAQQAVSSSRKLGQRLGNWMLWLVLAVGGIAMIGPFYFMVITSFKLQQEVTGFPPTWWPLHPTLRAYRTLTQLSARFDVSYRNSLLVAVTITVAVLLTSAWAGYVFAKFRFPGRGVLLILILSTLMVPFNVTLIPLYTLIVRLKWQNTYWALIVPGLFSPFGIFLMNQYMHSIPNDLIDAARMDGASEHAIFFRIIIPLAAAPMGALAIFKFMWTWDDFLWPLVVLDDQKLYTLPLALSQLRDQFVTDVAALCAGAALAVIPVLLVYVFAQRRFIEGIALTGMKG